MPDLISYTTEDEPLDAGEDFTVHTLTGTHMRLLWCEDEDAAILILTLPAREVCYELTAPVLRELAALAQHPQFAAALAAVDRETHKPPIADVS